MAFPLKPSSGMHNLALAALFFMSAGPALAATNSAFVDTWGDACLPERLSFERSVNRAASTGWQAVEDAADPELLAVMTRGRAAANDPEKPDWKSRFYAFRKIVGKRPLFLVITRFEAPEVISLIGCYLYDFKASAPLDPENVSRLLKLQVAYSTLNTNGDAYAPPNQIVSFVWGPPPGLPRQFDTYLSFIPENSPLAPKTGFTGLVLKSSASEPKNPQSSQ